MKACCAEHTNLFCAFWLGIGELLPVLSTFFTPNFIAANVFIPLCGRPDLNSCKIKTTNYACVSYKQQAYIVSCRL